MDPRAGHVAKKAPSIANKRSAQRRLPWQSTLQASLTLALANPALWYLIDRTRAGFGLAAAVGVAGTSLLLNSVPDIVPVPVDDRRVPIAGAPEGPLVGSPVPVPGLAWVSYESIGLWTWIASVLFCSALCFGNVGRRLARGWNGRRTTVGATRV